MKTISINFAKNTIEISAAFEKKASIYGSDAYRELMNAKHDFPEFTVEVVKPASKRKDTFKGLSEEYMENYIISHSGEESEQLKTFNILRGKVDGENGITAKASYGEIKLWFLNEYPEIENARAEIDAIIAKAKAERAAKKAA